jgi:hypothetical protein
MRTLMLLSLLVPAAQAQAFDPSTIAHEMGHNFDMVIEIDVNENGRPTGYSVEDADGRDIWWWMPEVGEEVVVAFATVWDDADIVHIAYPRDADYSPRAIAAIETVAWTAFQIEIEGINAGRASTP